MPSLVTQGLVLHAFDYLESSVILRLMTREAGLRSALARGARRSRRRFGGGLDLFSQGTATLDVRPGRELDTLNGFEGVRLRTALAADLDRFAGAGTIAEIVLRFGATAADAALFDALVAALDGLLATSPGSPDVARAATLAGAWSIVAALGHAPAVTACAECGGALHEHRTALFSHAAGGVLCERCASLSSGGRKLPPSARSAIAAWVAGEAAPVASEAEGRAHQRLLREFLEYHLHDGRELRAYALWEGADGSAP